MDHVELCQAGLQLGSSAGCASLPRSDNYEGDNDEGRHTSPANERGRTRTTCEAAAVMDSSPREILSVEPHRLPAAQEALNPSGSC